VTTLAPDSENPLLGISINRPDIVDIEPLKAELTAFIESIVEDKEPPVTVEDGRRALALALGVLEKIDAHRKHINV